MRHRLCGEGLLAVSFPVPGEEFVRTGLRQVGDVVETSAGQGS